MDAPKEQGMSLRIHEVFETEQSKMDSNEDAGELLWAQFRRGLLICIGCGCVLLGLTMMVTLVRPEMLMKLSTVELASIVGFVVFPAATLFAVRYDRSVVRRLRVALDDSGVQDESDRITHLAHERGVRGVLHQRSVEFGEKRADEHTPIETPAA